MKPNVVPTRVLLLAWLGSLVVTGALSFAVTWGFFETLGAWRWP